jgi:3-methyl-2-oxobutanoate hydroxymethyltransferase
MKRDGIPISMVTAYDHPSARLAQEAGVDAILVGDSLGNVVLGYDTTLPVTLDDMIHHARAVRRGAPDTFIVVDMPFLTYRLGPESTLRNAGRLMQETGAQAVKLEGGADIAQEVAALTAAGIPVMGHVGLKPQSIHQVGGYRVQGRQEADIRRLVDDAKALEQAGAFAVVLELVTNDAAEAVTKALGIPTIGIGAGAGCDGQVLVFHDMIRYASPYRSKRFVKTYADVGTVIREAIAAYVRDVKARAFPGPEHSFTGEPEPAASLYGGGEAKRDADH